MFQYSIIPVIAIIILYFIVLYHYYIAFVDNNAKIEAKYKKEVLEERQEMGTEDEMHWKQ